MRVYSSLAAFLAHYASLRATCDDAALLAEMERLIGSLAEADRAAILDHASTTGNAQRHRARAELKLRRLLTECGLLAG